MKKVLIVAGGNFKDFGRLRGFQAAFEKQGYKVSTFHNRWMHFNHFPITNQILNQALILKCKYEKPDLLYVFKGENILPGTLKKIKAIKVNRTVDEPFGRHIAFLKIRNIREYDAMFSFDREYTKELNKIVPSYYLPCCAVTSFYKPMKVKKIHNISFIGSYYKDREEKLWPLRNMGLKIWGINWHKSPKMMKFYQDEDSKEENYVRLLNQSKITLNFHHKQSILSTNYRTFEATAAKTFLLTEYNKELENLFEVGKEIEAFRTTKEMKEKISYYLENEDEREKIAEAGYKRTLKEHKMEDRIQTVLDVVHQLR